MPTEQTEFKRCVYDDFDVDVNIDELDECFDILDALGPGNKLFMYPTLTSKKCKKNK